MGMKREGKWFLGLDRLYVQLAEWSDDVRDEAWEQINIAYAKAQSEITRLRIDYVRQGNRLAYLLSKTLEEVHALRKDQSNLEEGLRAIFACVKETMTLYHSKIESDSTYGAAYYRGDRATRQFMWWKGYIGSIIKEILEGNAELHQRLSAENDTYRELIEAMTYPGVQQRIKDALEQRRMNL
jgi:hypothetical protein